MMARVFAQRFSSFLFLQNEGQKKKTCRMKQLLFSRGPKRKGEKGIFKKVTKK
jgi:hypothetical protein